MGVNNLFFDSGQKYQMKKKNQKMKKTKYKSKGNLDTKKIKNKIKRNKIAA